ncbi:hypothetical protein HDV00_008400 [Rhizophlyctis rosea]|nr:hypothetical protein HDV00_008400 [Rhizophlyctis rosea]
MRITSSALTALFFLSTVFAFPKGKKEEEHKSQGSQTEDKPAPPLNAPVIVAPPRVPVPINPVEICEKDDTEGLEEAGKISAVGMVEYECVNGTVEYVTPNVWTGWSVQSPNTFWSVVSDVLQGGPSKADVVECLNITSTDKKTTFTFKNTLNGTQTFKFTARKLCTVPASVTGGVAVTQYSISDDKDSESPIPKAKVVTQFISEVNGENSNAFVCKAADTVASKIPALKGLVKDAPFSATTSLFFNFETAMVELLFWAPKSDSKEEKKSSSSKDKKKND